LLLPRHWSWGPQEAAAQEVKARSAKHLALQHLQAIDMALHRACTPGQCHARFDRVVVLIQPLGKTLYDFQGTRGGALEPGLKLRRLPLADQGGKVLREVDGLGDLGRLCGELGELLGLRLGALRLAPQYQPGGAAWGQWRA
jgi:hypothetical protein